MVIQTAIFALLIALPLLRGGAFFPEQLLPALFLIGLLFIISLGWQWSSRPSSKLQAMDLCFLALGLAYFLALTGSVSLHSALLEAMKVLAYFMVYWMARNIAGDQVVFKRLLMAVYLAALLLALIGLGAALGWVSYPGAYADGHIRSTLQYHNALAIYLASATLIGWALSINEEKPLRAAAWLGGNYFLVAVIVGTMSRGTVLLYPLAAAFFFLFVFARQRGQAYSHLVLYLPLAWFAAAFVYGAFQAGHPGQSIVILLGGMLLVALAAWFYTSRLSTSIKKAAPRSRMIYALLAAVISMGLILAGNMYMSHQVTASAARQNPQNISDKFGRLSLGEQSVQERLITYQDAGKIIRDYPITGAGGGAWPLLYHRYAAKLYTANEMHSFYIKIMLETGILGLLALLALVLAFLRLVIRLWREAKEEKRPLLAAAISTLMLVGLHSAFDFDLSIPALAFMFFGIMGALQGQQLGGSCPGKSNDNKAAGITNGTRRVYPLIILILGMIMAAGLTAASAFSYCAQRMGDEGKLALQQARPGEAERLYARAARLDPLEADYPLNLALLNSIYFREKGDKTYYALALSYAEQAKELSPYSLEINAMLFRAYNLLRDTDRQLAACQEAVAGNPFIAQSYEALARVAMDSAWAALDRNQMENAQTYFNLVLQTRNEMPARVRGSVSRLNLAAGQSALFLGRFEQARQYLEASKSDPDCAQVAQRWLPAVAWLETRKHNQPDPKLAPADLVPLMSFLQSVPE